ncbi:hypothetical protein B0H14DRAFT_2589972 [Mycena olivaceomarginata]|nr:hypothetical protein B0H14DRAFT_2589972 [Mycena olivaceomarginata]
MHKGLTLCGGWKRTLSQTRSKLASEWKGTLSKSIALAAPQFFASGTPGGLNIPDQHFCKGGKEHRLRLASWMVQSHQVSKSASEWKGTPSIFIASAAPQFISSRTPGGRNTRDLYVCWGGKKHCLRAWFSRAYSALPTFAHYTPMPKLAGGWKGTLSIKRNGSPPRNTTERTLKLYVKNEGYKWRRNGKLQEYGGHQSYQLTPHGIQGPKNEKKKSKSRKRKGKTSPKDIEADHKNEALCDSDTSEETAQIDSTLAQAERAAATLAEAEQDASEALSEMWRRVQPAAPTREAPDGNTTAPDLFQDWSCPTGMLRTWKEGPILRRKAKQACKKEDDHFQEYIRGGRLLRSRVSRFPATMGKFHMAVQAVPSCTPASPRTGEGPDGTREGSIMFDDDQSEPDDQHKYGPQPPVLLSNCFQAITIMRVGLQTHKVVRRMVIQRKGEVQARNGMLVPKDTGPRTHDDPTLGSDLKEFRTLRMRFPTPSASSTPSPEPQSPMPSFSDYLDAYLRRRRHEGSR